MSGSTGSRSHAGMSHIQPRETDGKFGTKGQSRPEHGLERAPIEWPKHTCSECGEDVHHLEIFPGELCLDCYRPIGNEEAKTMTAEKLTKMWGG